MSTSDETQGSTRAVETGNWAAINGSEGLGPAPLSPAELARMANVMFNALPEPLQWPAAKAAATVLPANSAFSGNPYAAVPSPTAPAVPGLAAGVTELQPGVMAPAVDRGAAPDLGTQAAPATVPAGAQGVPGGGVGAPAGPGFGSASPGFVPAGLGFVSASPGFAFLEDVRPLYGEPAAEPAAANTAAAAFGNPAVNDEGYAAIPASLAIPGSLGTEGQPGQFAGVSQPPAPTAPGGLGGLDSSAIPAFSFLEEARPLFSTTPAIPGPVPADGAQVNPFAGPLDVNAPRVPGTVAPGANSGAPVGSEDGPRPLYAADGIPVVAPGPGQPELQSDLGLSSYSFDVEAIRRDFPILRERVNGHPLIWLDNGATTQKPQSVIDRISYFYEHENSNVHRAAHELAARATDAYESAREKTRRFLNAGSAREIVFVRGATEAINLVAQSWGRRNVEKDDEIVITWLEHHANIVPWQMLCAEKGARLRVAPVDDSGQVLLDEYEKLLGPKTRLVSITHVSNALGTVTPVKAMVEAAHRHGARVLVDGAQAVSHMKVDVQAIGCDFYVFSGHKVFAPTGIGVVYGKQEVLDNMPPWQAAGT